MRIYNLSKKVRDELSEQLGSTFGWKGDKMDDLKMAEMDDSEASIIFDTKIKLYVARLAKEKNEKESEIVPLLTDEQVLPLLPVVSVDSGAVKFVCNGANVMRPGVRKVEGGFRKSDLVLIREDKFGKGIAVGRASFDRPELEAMTKGPVVENLHYVGDRYWKALKVISK